MTRPCIDHPQIDLTVAGGIDHVRGRFASTFEDRDDEPGVLVLSGELCRITRPRLAAALRAALSLEPHGLVVDVGAVTFVDAGSVQELVATSAELRARGWALHIAGASTMFHRVLEVLGLQDLLLVDERPDEAPGCDVTAVGPGAHARTIGAALRRVTAELRVSRVEARRTLERHAQRSGLTLDQVAGRVADGTLPCSAITLVTVPPRLRIETDEITRRLEREYVVLRAGPRLDGTAAVGLERSLLATTPNADVVIDLRDCMAATTEGIEALLRMVDALAANDSTLTFSDPTPALIGTLAGTELLARLPVRHAPVARTRRRGGVDPTRR